MKALISSQEVVTNFDGTTGYRVAEVQETGFEVAEPLFWIDCADDVVADWFYYDTSDNTIKAVPVKPIVEKPAQSVGDAPNVIAE
jgi:hypothetical protein